MAAGDVGALIFRKIPHENVKP